MIQPDVSSVERVVGAFLIRRDEVLLGLRGPHKTYPNCWDMFGGHVEADETEFETLSRELTEELGIAPVQFQKIQQLQLKHDHGNLDIAVYLVSQWNPSEPTMLGNEHTEIRWFPFEVACSLPNLAASQIKTILQTLFR